MIINQLIKITNLMKKVTFTSFCLMLLWTFMLPVVSAQTNVNMPFINVPVTFTLAPPTVFSFTFFFFGGPAGVYSNSSNPALSIATFAPANSATHRVRATFTAFATENLFDALYIYSGNVAETNAAGPNPSISVGALVQNNQFNSGLPANFAFRAGGYMGGTSPGTVTSTAASGALTFQFDSDFSVVAAGWSAVISQVPITPCAMIPPANLTVSTGQTVCTADAVTPFPTFNPGGCQSSLTFRYSIDGAPPVVVPQPLPANLVVPGLTSGVHTITYSLVDPCGGAVISTAVQTITVQDLVPPVITCPADIDLTLDPGACAAFVGYTVEVTDNCPFLVPFLYTQNPPSLNPAQPIAFNSSLSCFVPPNFYGRVWEIGRAHV